MNCDVSNSLILIENKTGKIIGTYCGIDYYANQHLFTGKVKYSSE
jgi:hypothetical protein